MASKQANYFNISNDLFPNKEGYLSNDDDKTINVQVCTYLENNPNIEFGDILFIGSRSDRIEYGFYIVTENNQVLSLGEDNLFDILGYRNQTLLNKLKEKDIKYDEVIKLLVEEWDNILFFDGYDNIDSMYGNLIFTFYDENLIEGIEFDIQSERAALYCCEQTFSNILNKILEKKQVVFDLEDIKKNPIHLCLQKILYFTTKFNYDSLPDSIKKKLDQNIEMTILLIQYGIDITPFYNIESNTFYTYTNNREEQIYLPEDIKNRILNI